MTSKMDSWTQLYILPCFAVSCFSLLDFLGFLSMAFVVSPCLKQQTSIVKRDVACAVYNIVTDAPVFVFSDFAGDHRTRVRWYPPWISLRQFDYLSIYFQLQMANIQCDPDGFCYRKQFKTIGIFIIKQFLVKKFRFIWNLIHKYMYILLNYECIWG